MCRGSRKQGSEPSAKNASLLIHACQPIRVNPFVSRSRLSCLPVNTYLLLTRHCNQPSIQPTNQPTNQPSNQPSNQPTNTATNQPTNQHCNQPTLQPTIQPTNQRTCNIQTCMHTHTPQTDCKVTAVSQHWQRSGEAVKASK